MPRVARARTRKLRSKDRIHAEATLQRATTQCTTTKRTTTQRATIDCASSERATTLRAATRRDSRREARVACASQLKVSREALRFYALHRKPPLVLVLFKRLR